MPAPTRSSNDRAPIGLVRRKFAQRWNDPKIDAFALHSSVGYQGGGNGREVLDKQVERPSAEAGDTTLKRSLAADLLQMARPLTIDAIVDCSKGGVGARFGRLDRVDPPGAI